MSLNLTSLINQGLAIIPDNVFEGMENITLTFKVPTANNGVDEFGNAIATTQDLSLTGRAVRTSNRDNTDETAGGDSSYLLLKMNVTAVDGVEGANIPDTVTSSSVAIAQYVGGDGRNYNGQFYVLPSTAFSVSAIYAKVGGILFGKFEVSGG